MRASEMERLLVRTAVETSGHEQDRYRGWLGMSQISRTEEELVAMMLGHGWEPMEKDYLRLRSGRVFEGVVRSLLFGAGLVEEDVIFADEEEMEVVAGFDDRFRGHIDGYLVEGSLVEIKSTFQEKLDRIRESRRLPRSVYEQVQMYLFHGRYQSGFVVYIARDTGALYVMHVRPNPGVQRKLNDKARRVLAAYDRALARGVTEEAA